MRTRRFIIAVLLLGMVGALAPLAGGTALACDQAEAVAAEAIAAEGAVAVAEAVAATPAPPVPRAPRGPAPPSPGEAPAPAAAPAAPEAGLETPGVSSLVTPRGWFGFGFLCGDCSATTGLLDSAAVWQFRTWPRVYSVDVGSPAARAGLRRGDVITQIDGISILTREGGRRFGAIRPGQAVRWTLLRDGSLRYVVAHAAERPERPERRALTDLRREVSRERLELRQELRRLNEMSDLDQLRRELATLNRRLDRLKVENLDHAKLLEAQRIRIDPRTLRRLRYAGVIGGAEVEVRGTGSVIVSETDDKDELVINTGESVVVIRLPEAARKKASRERK